MTPDRAHLLLGLEIWFFLYENTFKNLKKNQQTYASVLDMCKVCDKMTIVLLCAKKQTQCSFVTTNIFQNEYLFFLHRAPQILFHHETLHMCGTLVSCPYFFRFVWSVFIFYEFQKHARTCDLGSQKGFLILFAIVSHIHHGTWVCIFMDEYFSRERHFVSRVHIHLLFKIYLNTFEM